MKWKKFKTDPPYDAYEDDQNGYETDYEYCWFLYRHTHRPNTMNNKPILSHKACKFSQGIFEGYESHMRTSPYEVDWIEILYWCRDTDVSEHVLADAMYHHLDIENEKKIDI